MRDKDVTGEDWLERSSVRELRYAVLFFFFSNNSVTKVSIRLAVDSTRPPCVNTYFGIVATAVLLTAALPYHARFTHDEKNNSKTSFFPDCCVPGYTAGTC